LASSRAQAFLRESATTSRSFGASGSAGSAVALRPYQFTTAEAKLSARNDDRVFRLLDGIDPSPYRFGRRYLFTLSRNLLEYSPGTWNIPVHFIN
jgi:hypothetical protein